VSGTRPPAVRPAFAFGNATRVFRHRNYRLNFGGQLVSLVGTWMQQVAQGWLVLQLTNDPFLLGLTVAVQFLPVMVLGLFGGLLADALPKRRTLIVTQAVQMVLAFVLFGLVASGAVELWHIILLAVLLGTTQAVDMPARQAFTMEMVGREDLPSAVGINSSVFNAARIVGPAVAGLTIGAFDISIAFLVNGLSFLAAIAAYALMRESELEPAPPSARPTSVAEVGSSLMDGLRYVRRTEIVLLATVVIGLVSMFGMSFGVLIPALARDVLGVGATGFGFLMAATGVGSLVAALTLAFSGRSRTAMIAAGAVILGAAEVVAAIVHAYPLALVAMVFIGYGAIAMGATANTTIQLNVPDELRGRVLSVFTTVFVGATPVGSLLMGGIASWFGVEVALAVGGFACVAVGTVAWARLRAISGGQIAARAAAGSAARPAAQLVEGGRIAAVESPARQP